MNHKQTVEEFIGAITGVEGIEVVSHREMGSEEWLVLASRGVGYFLDITRAYWCNNETQCKARLVYNHKNGTLVKLCNLTQANAEKMVAAMRPAQPEVNQGLLK